MSVNNVRTSSGALIGLGDLESTDGATIKNMRGYMFYVVACSNVTMINCLLPGSNYFQECDNVNLYHCYMELNIQQQGQLGALVGCIFPKSISASINTAANKPLFESNNIIGKNINGNYIEYFITDVSQGYNVTDSNLADYLATGKGLNSVFISNGSLLKTNSQYSLKNASVGKRIIDTVIHGIVDDTSGSPRTFPTDPGPWQGSNPGEPEKADAPTWDVNVIDRELRVVSEYPDTEIVVSYNGGEFAPYTPPITFSDVSQPAGLWAAKIKSGFLREESNLSLSPYIIPFPPGAMKVTGWVETLGWTVVGGNSLRNLDPSNNPYTRARSTAHFNEGDVGYVRAQVGESIGLHDQELGIPAGYGLNYYIGTGNGGIFANKSVDNIGVFSHNGKAVVMIELTLTEVIFKYSIDNEATFVQLGPAVSRDPGTLWIKASEATDSSQSVDNIYGVGFTIE